MMLEHIKASRTAEMDDLIALYEEAIPLEERKPADAIREMASSLTHTVAVAKQGRHFAGFFILFKGAKVSMLEYLAVSDHVRGSGIGSFLYRSARAEAGGRPLIVEIESADVAAPLAEQSLRRRRLAFYLDLGCRLVRDVDYILPLPGADRAPPIALLLDNHAGDIVALGQFAEWLEELYVHVYSCAPDDARLINMIQSLPDPVPLG